MDLQSIIEHYGYAAILIGTFLEGETILVLAGLAAHQGYLVLIWVMMAAFWAVFAAISFFYIWDVIMPKILVLGKQPQFRTIL